MSKRLIAIAVGMVLVGCRKSQEAQNAENALKAIASVTSGGAAETQAEAEKFYEQRKAKGDTVAIAYTELQKSLPPAVGDYKPEGEPSGSSQSMGSFSMSQAEQNYVLPATADGTVPSVKVTIADMGGTQTAYSMMALPMMMNLSSEDAHHRMATGKLGTAYTWYTEEFDKDNKDSKVSVVTRYRYLITVEARNQTADQVAMVKGIAEAIAKTFDGK
jgi:hypothetical protein